MKCHILFSGKIRKKNITNLSSAELAQTVVEVKLVLPYKLQSNLNGSNIFGTMEACSRYG